MKMIWFTAVAIYISGFTVAFIVGGGGQGPADMQLTLLRSTVWPWYLTTGRPNRNTIPDGLRTHSHLEQRP